MSKIKLTPYQATVFRDVETLLKTRGNLQGVKVNPKAYWLSKRMAVYIMHNIAKNQPGTDNVLDVEDVYNWIFGILPSPSNNPVSGTGNSPPPPPPPPPPTVGFKDIGLSFGMTSVQVQNTPASSKQTLSFATPPGFPPSGGTGVTLYSRSPLNLGFGGVKSFFKIGSLDGDSSHPLAGDIIELTDSGQSAIYTAQDLGGATTTPLYQYTIVDYTSNP
tara:strand:+ start:27 stop:680 length:654 start_codon:yes stop_codon:yes gene_type:complete